MAASSELNAFKFATNQSILGPTPVTVTAAATIAPVSFITIVTGNTAVATMTPPLQGEHMLCIVPGTSTGFTTGGNVSGGTTTVSGRAYLFVYNPATATYLLVSTTTS